ncbi:MAG: hypothetical protein ACI9UJ_001068 [bacterium]|jgi:hypothetical protein
MDRFLIILFLLIAPTQLFGQTDTTNALNQPARLTASVFFDPTFLVYPYIASDVGLELRIANRVTLNSKIGVYTNPNWLDNHIEASGIHSFTGVRYYSRNSLVFLSVAYGYQDLTTTFYGTFPSSTGHYLKKLQLNQFRNTYTLNIGSRSPKIGRLQFEFNFGIGPEYVNNHFTVLTAFESKLILEDRIPEVKKEGGTNTYVDVGYIWNLRLLYTVIK